MPYAIESSVENQWPLRHLQGSLDQVGVPWELLYADDPLLSLQKAWRNLL